ncbi:MAG: hypothetical protein P0119_04955 [Nitrospira sp.]|nr:hypothetical protein [Nitrospira sp.]
MARAIMPAGPCRMAAEKPSPGRVIRTNDIMASLSRVREPPHGFHDCAHVLSGYGTAPEGEVQVACFSAGFQRREPWMFVFFVLLQFHVGIRMTPITQARTGMFDPLKAMIAIRRGAAMNVDLNDGWDYWPVMGEQVEELRHRYNILPVEAFLPAKHETIAAVA